MPIFSNIDEVGDWLRATIAEIGFDMEAEHGNTLGEACVNAVVNGIQQRSFIEQSGGDGDAWPANDPLYLEDKIEHYGADLVNVRTKHMLSDRSVRGEVVVTHDTVTMEYGDNSIAMETTTGHIERSDQRRTDRQKAAYAHEQGREFFDLDDQWTNAPVFEIVGNAVANHLQSKANA